MSNDTDQQTRRQVLKDCYLNRAQAEADMAAGGRWKNQNPTSVTGAPSYPRQPSNSPWHSDPVPPEEPLGYEIDAQPELGGAPALPCAATATPDDGGTAPPKGRDSPLPVSTHSLRRREW